VDGEEVKLGPAAGETYPAGPAQLVLRRGAEESEPIEVTIS
jgi:hypothetical protein